MDGNKKRNWSRLVQAGEEDNSDASVNFGRILEPPFELGNRRSRGLSAQLVGPYPAGGPTWPLGLVPPPQQPPLVSLNERPAVAQSRDDTCLEAQAQVIKLLAVQESTRSMVRNIYKLLPTADHRLAFHNEVINQQILMERHHQSKLKQRLLSVTRAMAGGSHVSAGPACEGHHHMCRHSGARAGMGKNGGNAHHPMCRHYKPSARQDDDSAVEAHLATMSVGGTGTGTASVAVEPTTEAVTSQGRSDEQKPVNSD